MYSEYALVDNVVSPEEASRLIEWGEENFSAAKLIGSKLDWKKRRSKVAWITPGSEFEPIMSRLVDTLASVARDFYKTEINGAEPIQLTKYTAGCFYGRHMDALLSGSNRIISASIELSDPKSYIGGGISFPYHPNPKAKAKQGTMVCFPSLMIHAARPVFWGTRHSLVIWGTKNDPDQNVTG